MKWRNSITCNLLLPNTGFGEVWRGHCKPINQLIYHRVMYKIPGERKKNTSQASCIDSVLGPLCEWRTHGLWLCLYAAIWITAALKEHRAAVEGTDVCMSVWHYLGVQVSAFTYCEPWHYQLRGHSVTQSHRGKDDEDVWRWSMISLGGLNGVKWTNCTWDAASENVHEANVTGNKRRWQVGRKD